MSRPSPRLAVRVPSTLVVLVGWIAASACGAILAPNDDLRRCENKDDCKPTADMPIDPRYEHSCFKDTSLPRAVEGICEAVEREISCDPNTYRDATKQPEEQVEFLLRAEVLKGGAVGGRQDRELSALKDQFCRSMWCSEDAVCEGAVCKRECQREGGCVEYTYTPEGKDKPEPFPVYVPVPDDEAASCARGDVAKVTLGPAVAPGG